MIDKLLKSLVETMLELLPDEKAKEIVDKALDKIEQTVEASSNKLDDAIVLPIIKKLIREPFGIEDND